MIFFIFNKASDNKFFIEIKSCSSSFKWKQCLFLQKIIQYLLLNDNPMAKDHIQICKNEIEKSLKWGPADDWTNHDFEQLVEEIFAKTGANVSITTLKRVWGKVDYQSKPSISTLNVLALYLGYAHWRDFQINFIEVSR